MNEPIILVVDDERLARQRLVRFLESYGVALRVIEAINAAEGLQKIVSDQPNVVFLDIEMPGMSGIEMLAHVEKRDFSLIFATAFDEFAIRAFEESACDYLLKPFDQERLFKALDRALSTKAGFGEEVRRAEQSLLGRDNFLSHLLIKRNGMVFKISTGEIQGLTSQDNYTLVITDSEEFLSDLSLNHLETRLNPNKFIRTHRSGMVNVDYIDKVNLSDEASVTLRNGKIIALSRRNRGRLREIFEKEGQ